MKIMQIKGANGAGKSTIPLQLLECSKDVAYQQWEYVEVSIGADGFQIPSRSYVNTVLRDLGWVLIGPYGMSSSPTSNGCDNLSKVGAVKAAILNAIEVYPEFDILFEGMMISTIKSTFYDFLMDMRPQVDPLFVILDATLEGCLRRLDARGSSKRTERLVDNIRKKVEGIKRHAWTYDQAYVRWLNVEGIELDQMLDSFLAVIDMYPSDDLGEPLETIYLPRQYESYASILKMSNSEVYEQLVPFVGHKAADKMDRGQRKRALAGYLVEPLEVDRSGCPDVDLEPFSRMESEWPFKLLYGEEVGYATDSGNELSLWVQMHLMDRKDVPLMTEFEQVMSCRDCKGSRGGCPGYAPRFDTLKPSYPYFALLTISMDMAWALKYGARHTSYIPSSWADIITQSYTRRIIGKFTRVGYTLGLGACPGCRRKDCAVLQGGRCSKPKVRHYSCEATGVDCDWLHYMLYGEWLPWLYKGHAKVPYYTTRYAGVLVDPVYKDEGLVKVLDDAVHFDKSYIPVYPDPPDYPLEEFEIPSGVHKGCIQYVYDLEVTE